MCKVVFLKSGAVKVITLPLNNPRVAKTLQNLSLNSIMFKMCRQITFCFMHQKLRTPAFYF